MANAIIRRQMRKLAAARAAKQTTVVEEVKPVEPVIEPVIEPTVVEKVEVSPVVEEVLKTTVKKKKTTTLTE